MKSVNEGFIKNAEPHFDMVWLPIGPRKPDAKFREAETEAEAGRKNNNEAEAEAEAIKNII